MKKIVSIVSLVLGAAFIAPANAAIIVKDLNNPVTIPGLTGFATDGDDMDGVKITAMFDNDISQTVLFSGGANDVDGFGIAQGDGWSVSASGDTFQPAAWQFLNSTGAALLSLVLDGSDAFTVWDTTDPSTGTTDSARGRDFMSDLSNDDSIIATYSNVVAVSPNDPVGDLFHTVTIDFGDGAMGGFRFSQDADNDARLIDVPEPGSIALIGLGLLGFAMSRRRRL